LKTLGIDQREPGYEEDREPIAWLVRVGSAGSPLKKPELIPLTGERLVLGRRDTGDLHAPTANASTPERAEVFDPWMSGEHAAVVNVAPGKYELRDLGSSNGTWIWGQKRSSAVLEDGDLFDTGGTFWLFRHMVADHLPPFPSDELLGSLYPPLIELADRVRRVARTRVPVMLLGATGTGKEVIARELHRLSGRTGPFVAINTGAVQRSLVASELFGVERGAHSMADSARTGQVRAAEGGTFLLDEIGDTPIEVQVALLRLLQESEVLPVGGTLPMKVDVRFVCATHRDLSAMVKSGEFRADLFGRIKGCTLEAPSLEDRAEDIGLLIGRFLEKYGGEQMTFSTAAYRALVQYQWPLNVRELEKVVETAIALAPRDRIELEHLPREIASAPRPEGRSKESIPVDKDDDAPDAGLARELDRMMQVHKGNVSRVAKSMGYSRMQVHRWMKRLNVNPDHYRR
jgi:transcriptional regulator with AAA-type ATPase domain